MVHVSPNKLQAADVPLFNPAPRSIRNISVPIRHEQLILGGHIKEAQRVCPIQRAGIRWLSVPALLGIRQPYAKIFVNFCTLKSIEK
jgi:hypothetical protein